MQITRETLIGTLRDKIPKFPINSDWVQDNLGYPIINDLGRYVCEQASLGDYDEVKKCLDFLEMCIEHGDANIQDLVHECLEGILFCEAIAEIKVNFGPHVLAMWNNFFEATYRKRL